jgi:tetratricopeptide (TPR) repeat protein
MRLFAATAIATLALFSAVAGAHTQSAEITAKDLAKLQKKYSITKANYGRHKSASAKKAYVDATVEYALASEETQALDRKVKYRQALRLYREALKIDPTNQPAKVYSDQIIAIYKSMGRPVPM